jgi:hypothetical protein
MAYQVIPIVARVAPVVARKLIKESPKIYKKLSSGFGSKQDIPGRIVRAEIEYTKQSKKRKNNG